MGPKCEDLFSFPAALTYAAYFCEVPPQSTPPTHKFIFTYIREPILLVGLASTVSPNCIKFEFMILGGMLIQQTNRNTCCLMAFTPSEMGVKPGGLSVNAREDLPSAL